MQQNAPSSEFSKEDIELELQIQKLSRVYIEIQQKEKEWFLESEAWRLKTRLSPDQNFPRILEEIDLRIQNALSIVASDGSFHMRKLFFESEILKHILNVIGNYEMFASFLNKNDPQSYKKVSPVIERLNVKFDTVISVLLKYEISMKDDL